MTDLSRRPGRARWIFLGFIAGVVVACAAPLAYLRARDCEAIGWRPLDNQADPWRLPGLLPVDPWMCRPVGPFRRYRGVWTYGERSNWFAPDNAGRGEASGSLIIDEAAQNLVFDQVFHRRLSRIPGGRVEIEFEGNALLPNPRDRSAVVAYEVRHILGVKFIEPAHGEGAQ